MKKILVKIWNYLKNIPGPVKSPDHEFLDTIEEIERNNRNKELKKM